MRQTVALGSGPGIGMNLLRLSISLLRRDWREGEWRVLLLSLVLAVGSLSTVGLFADRVRQALQQQAQSLIGADLRITSTRPLSPEYLDAAHAQGLKTVSSKTFPSMVLHRGSSLLSQIQAVGTGYPLRGEIVIDDGVIHAARAIPTPGTIWVDARLLYRLNLRLGDEVSIGAQRFKIAARIEKDIDQSIGFGNYAPKVLMGSDDLAATGLLREGSRVTYRLMIAGDVQRISTLRTELQRHLLSSERMEDVRDARPDISTALQRSEHFLGLAALTAAILAGAAIALAARRFVQRHLDSCAVMRCFGAQQSQILWLFLYQFLLLGVSGALLGCALGYVVQGALIASVDSLRHAALPQPGLLPAVKAAASGFVLLLGFAFLPLLQLRKVSPLRVLRRELGAPKMNTGLMYGLAMLTLSGLFLWQAGSIKLGMVMLSGLLGGLLCFTVLAWLLLRGMAHFTLPLPLYWRHALANLARHGRTNAIQMVALSLGGTALLLLTLVRQDLLQGWQGKLPADTPNRFIVNIQPDQRQSLLDFFSQRQLTQPQLLPMVRGRLIAINQRSIDETSYAEPRARALVEREFNLSWAEHLPIWNELVQGQWWDNAELEIKDSGQKRDGQLSVEEGIAKTLNIHLGDELTYDIAGSRFTARVGNLRKVQWDDMQVNFYVITTPQLLHDYPASYLTSFYLPADKARFSDELAQHFSNLVVINMDDVINQVRTIIEQISQTISIVFLFTLLAGVVVLYSTLLFTYDERIHGTAVLRTLGASGAYLRRLQMSEFAVLGLFSGLFSAAGASLLGWALAYFVIDIPYQPGILVWVAGMAGGMLIMMCAEWLVTRRLMRLPPLVLLRE